MQVSLIPTGTIAIKARTGSEWDNIDFALLHITEQSIRDMKERLECPTMVKDSRNFAGLRYWDDPDGWYMYGEGEEFEKLSEVLDFQDWCYLDITEDEINDLGAPEQRIDGVTLKIQTDKSQQFTGYGKHTSEEFWTSDVPMDTLIKDFEKTLQTA